MDVDAKNKRDKPSTPERPQGRSKPAASAPPKRLKGTPTVDADAKTPATATNAPESPSDNPDELFEPTIKNPQLYDSTIPLYIRFCYTKLAFLVPHT